MYKLTQPRHEGFVEVREGRNLGYADFGSESGRTILWYHGTPGGRRQVPEDARVMANKLDLRVIGVDRPGIGYSTSHHYRNILDFTSDVEILLNELNVDRCAVVGLSGGGPYTLATAYAMPDRITAAGVLGGVVPHVGEESMEGGLVGFFSRLRPGLPFISPPVSRLLQLAIMGLGPFGIPAIDLFARLTPEGDQIVFAREEIKAMFIDDIKGNSRHGIAAPLNDLALFLRPWGFSVSDIAVPVRWWHGDADNFVPLAHAEHLVPLIPNAQLYLRPGESHLGGLGAAEEVLNVLLELWT
jgi:pimeloyl-ACP methyl ester carboxylesterase